MEWSLTYDMEHVSGLDEGARGHGTARRGCGRIVISMRSRRTILAWSIPFSGACPMIVLEVTLRYSKKSKSL